MNVDLIYKHFTCDYNTTKVRAVLDLTLGNSEQAYGIFSLACDGLRSEVEDKPNASKGRKFLLTTDSARCWKPAYLHRNKIHE